MTLQMTVSPDFAPDRIGGWYILSTWLQRHLDLRIHLELFNSFEEQRAAIEADQIDLIYANPYDASMLVRERNFISIAAPLGRQDEVVLAASAESGVSKVEDLEPGTRVAAAADPEVNMIGQILLEPADLTKDAIAWVHASSYTAVARLLLQRKADVGFFLRESFQDLSGITRRQMNVLVESKISVIRHLLLAGPRAHHLVTPMQAALSSMAQDARPVLESLQFEGFESVDHEYTEFMIDLIDTLQA